RARHGSVTEPRDDISVTKPAQPTLFEVPKPNLNLELEEDHGFPYSASPSQIDRRDLFALYDRYPRKAARPVALVAIENAVRRLSQELAEHDPERMPWDREPSLAKKSFSDQLQWLYQKV